MSLPVDFDPKLRGAETTPTVAAEKLPLTTASLNGLDLERITEKIGGKLHLHPLNGNGINYAQITFTRPYSTELNEIILNGPETTMVLPGYGILKFPKPLLVDYDQGTVRFINEEPEQIPGEEHPENELGAVVILSSGAISLQRRS